MTHEGLYGQGQAGVLRRAVHERLLMHEASGDLPTSNRFILYELRQFAAAVLYGYRSRGQGRSEDQNLSDASKWLRDEGYVPWDWIVDETRSLTAYLYAETLASISPTPSTMPASTVGATRRRR
jgi:hypothetical protein